MKCQKCSSEMNRVYNMDHYHCVSCNVYQFPPDLANSSYAIEPTGKTTDFICPVCLDTNLEVGKIKGSQVCFCNNCHGYVVDTDTLGNLIANLRAAYHGLNDQPVLMNQTELQVATPCPACLEPMQTHPYYGPGNVILDSCMNCKLSWMDHGELDKIIKAPGVRT